jgi:hypothetical protein
MNKNIGKIDIIVRLLIAVLVFILFFMVQITGIIAIVLMAAAAGLIITTIFGICPLYYVFRISTLRKE